MSDLFTLRSNDGARLEFRGNPRSPGNSRYVVALVGSEVSAKVRVHDHFVESWTNFFRALATDWKGWKGPKSMEALEGQVALSCSSDSLGHISMRVVLRDTDSRSDWSVETTLHLESGQLDEIAIEAEEYFGRGTDHPSV